MRSIVEELETLKYFWDTKRDLTRYVDWDVVKFELSSSHPEIVRAWENYVLAEITMTSVLKAAIEEEEE